MMSDNQHDQQDQVDELEEEIVVLTDENGNDHEFVVLYVFEAESKEYAVLLPKDDEEGDGVIMRVEVDGEEEYLVDIEDEEEWGRVVAAYETLIADDENNQE